MSDLKSAQPHTLPCGLTLPNRLVNAAMAESLAGKDGLPNKRSYRPYAEWAKGGWGMVLTGAEINNDHHHHHHHSLLTLIHRQCAS